MLGSDLNTDLELIYFHANGGSHPVMWTLGQEESNNMLPAMWGIMPPKEKQKNYTEYFKNPKTLGD